MRQRLIFTCITAVLLGACNPAAPVVLNVSTFAGSGTDGTADGKGAAAQFHNPVNVVFDDAGNLYVADFHDDNPGRIRKIAEDGTVSTLFTQANFQRPFGLAYRAGFLYVTTDRELNGNGNSSLWKINVNNGAGTTPVDNINSGRERGIVVKTDGTVIAADRRRHVILKIDLSGPAAVVTVLAGMEDMSGYHDGASNEAHFNEPYGLALLGNDVLVADMTNNCVRLVKPNGDTSTFAGVCGPGGGYKDGTTAEALFKGPQDLAVDADNNVYVTDNGNHRIRKISGGKVSTIAGNGLLGFKDDKPLASQFYAQEGIDVKPGSKWLFVADGNGGNEPQPYRRIRQVPLP
ncbi:hypothetical protein [Deinococcus roseus]|uniref:NHL repeat-containing protein n=1 Tax=Deinococcus roseus TaxID=392414 RepID=A0ABQ2D958_9DEIO|nr:hypothetical protein [Deinococcus roseus]GGJ50205.1 hypothetical protein GCM10008938_40210 [Deinococcus roseus]